MLLTGERALYGDDERAPLSALGGRGRLPAEMSASTSILSSSNAASKDIVLRGGLDIMALLIAWPYLGSLIEAGRSSVMVIGQKGSCRRRTSSIDLKRLSARRRGRNESEAEKNCSSTFDDASGMASVGLSLNFRCGFISQREA